MSDCTCGTDITCKECSKDPLELLKPGIVTDFRNGQEHDAGGIREQMAEDHPDHYSPERKSHETLMFEEVLKATQNERSELEEEEAHLAERLNEVRDRLHALYPVEGTMTWLQDHIFNFDQKQAAVRDMLPGLSSTYNSLMIAYHRLRKAKGIVVTDGGIRFKNPTGTHGPARWHCKLCYRSFQSPADLDRHVESGCEYMGNEEYQKEYEHYRELRLRTCSVCTFVAKTSAGLKTHVRIKHSNHEAKDIGKNKNPKKGKK